jgi:general stress protein 26
MTDKQPVTMLEPQFSSDGATPTAWEEAREQLEKAEVYWLSTVRPDGRPHVTPLIGIWLDGALYFCTGPTERKTKNLLHTTHCIITTGCNSLQEGLDLVVEGDAVKVSDEHTLQRLTQSYAAKYGWHFTVRDGALFGEGGEAWTYAVRPSTAFGFRKGAVSSQTRWRF